MFDEWGIGHVAGLKGTVDHMVPPLIAERASLPRLAKTSSSWSRRAVGLHGGNRRLSPLKNAGYNRPLVGSSRRSRPFRVRLSSLVTENKEAQLHVSI